MPETRVANIGPRGRKRRLGFGVVAFGISVVAAIWLIAGGAPLLWRSALVLPLFAAALGYFQARDKT